MNQSWTFWDRTLNAHLDAAVFRLCKIFDQDKTNRSESTVVKRIRAYRLS